MMLTVLTPQKDGLKLWWVIIKPPVKMEVRLRILGVFVSSCQNFKWTNQLQTQQVFQCTLRQAKTIDWYINQLTSDITCVTLAYFCPISNVTSHCVCAHHTTGAVRTKLLAEVPEVVQIFWHLKLVQLHHFITLIWIHLWQRHSFGFISAGFLQLPVASNRLLKKCITRKNNYVILAFNIAAL